MKFVRCLLSFESDPSNRRFFEDELELKVDGSGRSDDAPRPPAAGLVAPSFVTGEASLLKGRLLEGRLLELEG